VRLGTSPGAVRELVQHAARYGLAGMVVATTYVGLTLLLSGPAGLPIQLVIPVALTAAGVLHFALQRRFVFTDRDEFALAPAAQARWYLVIAIVQYAVTAASTALLPGFLGTTEQVVYVATVVAVSGTTFLFMRSRVFHVA
jgi:putative flippase GtrA